ncbi:hypothetical protein F542_3860 [Bibersteinia trehalosi USDA-ARS-USMARC-188]|uniref:Uncharacterized protein n=2 Tax=Bibersteinia trehalosi TaxID=47735 RepID=A0A4V7I7W3_BIBTR|nr:hypothetical protein WQG_18720 [Bibersteinia trehalosi USDA-ARS-USMARC-192]AHG81104.1 hypothetical protein F542_3860 [Bibersteinia trehalosi USDA-ARS-USMARC-188]AHG83315.1 hypothetical protein F543_4510 [Bibersteinia trehalosi USDA-ARS-USMARC-189]
MKQKPKSNRLPIQAVKKFNKFAKKPDCLHSQVFLYFAIR